jgi:hypothetical protein
MQAAPYLAPLALALVLAGCQPEADSVDEGERDPAVAQALNDQLLVDPDLVGQNEASAALTGGSDQSVPLEIATTEAIRSAQQRALALVGEDGVLPELPAARPLPDQSPMSFLAQEAARVGGIRVCMDRAEQSAIWAARLPVQLPVYPRGATQDAIGSDAAGCSFRAVRFTTPVAAEDVAAFYQASARKAGYRTTYLAGSGQRRIEGTRGDARVVVHLRPGLDDTVEVDLIVTAG